MKPKNPLEQSIFLSALELLTPAERDAYVRGTCGGDESLRRAVEELLAAHERANPLDAPPVAHMPTASGRTADLPPTEGPGTMIGPYKLLEPIGEGGMGTVWMAQQTEPVKRLVAVKLIRAGMDSKQVIARFEAERQALALMDHPNIARVLDAGTTDAGRPYFVMDLVKGVPITAFCDQNHLTPRQRLDLFIPVCQAIQHAHQKGIIHRDLKPSNVLVALYDGRPVPKVIDFGVAKAAGQPLTDQSLVTGFGNIVGTLEYMSPEQAELNQLDIDTRSDIYSLGVLLYELLTGTTPLERKRIKDTGILEALRIIREEETPTLSNRLNTTAELKSIAANRGTEPAKLTKLVRGELDWIVMKALEKDRNRRYETATGFAMDMQRYLADEPVLAGPLSTWYRIRKFGRRNKAALATASLVTMALLLAVTSLAVGTVLLWREKEQTRGEWQRAEREKDRADADRRLTRKALDEMTSEVIEDVLARQPELTAEQHRFLETTIGYYKQFAAQTGSTEEARAGVAEAHDRVGVISTRLGRAKQAEAAYRDAERLWAQLAADYPAAHVYRRNVAVSQHNLANLLVNANQLTEAEEALGAALATHRKLADEFHTLPEYQNDLAGTLVDLANVRIKRNELHRARELLEEACPHHEAALAAKPRHPVYLRFYRNNLSKLATICGDLGDYGAALAAFRDSLSLARKLEAEFSHDPEHRRYIASTQSSIAAVLATTNQPKEAEAAYADALAIQERLANDYPAVPMHRHELAVTYQNLGVLQFNWRRLDDAKASFRSALKNWQLLVQRFPTPEYRYGLSVSHNHFASLLAQTGQLNEAEPEFQAALKLLLELTKDGAGLPEYHFRLADAHNNYGTLLTSLHRWPEAENEYRVSLAIQEGLVRRYQHVRLYSVMLGRTLYDFGQLHTARGQPEAALKWYDKAIATVQQALENEARHALGRRVLRSALSGRAEVLGTLKRFPDAIKDWDGAIESDDDKLVGLRLKRADALARCSEHVRATAEADALANAPDALKEVVYDAACIFAVSSAAVSSDAQQSERYAARAVELLRRANQRGFHDVQHMKKDPDLDSLRQRADFKTTLAELEKAATPRPGKAP